MRRLVLGRSCLAVLAVLAGAAVAHADKAKLGVDQALAKRIVLKASELGAGWSGNKCVGRTAVAKPA